MIPGTRLERDVRCETRDGVLLSADVWRPEEPGRYPVLLQRTPYGTTGESDIAYAHPSWYARHGYVVVVQDCRGRYGSGGDFEPFVHEAQDGHDAIEWAARLPEADGRVGMYGFSYCGATQLLAATLRPPSLVAIAPGMTGSQYYEGWTYVGGALSLAFVAQWAAGLALDDALRAGDDAAAGQLQALLGSLPGGYLGLPVPGLPGLEDVSYYQDWLEHWTDDDFWQRWAIDADYGRITVPALHLAGLWDVFLTGTVSNFTGLRAVGAAPQRLVVAPLTHMPWSPAATPGPGIEAAEAGANVLDDWQLRWFDHWLKDRDSGVLDPAASVWVLGAGWRDFAGWPPPEARPVEWHLRSGGRANTAAGDGRLDRAGAPAGELPDVFVYNPALPVPSQGGHSCCFDTMTPMGPACQCATERLKGVLVYSTAPLERDLEICGDAALTLWAISSAVDTDFCARLCVVGADGCSRNLQEGVIRSSFRESAREPEPIEPGRAYEYRIELGPVAVRIAAGERLRLDVSSSDFPLWERNLNTGERWGTTGVVATQVVLHDAEHPSRLTLPVLEDA